MASCTYLSFYDDALRGLLDVDGATFRVLLTGSGYVENQTTHLTRADLGANELATGNGYTALGALSTVTITKNAGARTVTVSLGGATWTTAAGQTLTARKAVWYMVAGGVAANERLVAVNDFGTDQIASGGGTLTLPASTITLTVAAPA